MAFVLEVSCHGAGAYQVDLRTPSPAANACMQRLSVYRPPSRRGHALAQLVDWESGETSLTPPAEAPHPSDAMSDRNNVVVIFVTAPDAETAASLGRALVEERLVACVNIVPGIRSLYRWEGRVQDSAEVLMLLKARGRDFQAIAARVGDLHPYEVPEVIGIEIVAGLGAYLDWVQSETERG